MQTKPAAHHGKAPRAIQPGSTLVAWLLMFMALSAFAPCVLLPELRTLQSLRVAEQREQHRLASMQSVVDHERRWINAIQADPVVAERLASRELGFTNPGVVTVSVAVDSAPAPQAGGSQSHEPLRPVGLANPAGANLSRGREPTETSLSRGSGTPLRWQPAGANLHRVPDKPARWQLADTAGPVTGLAPGALSKPAPLRPVLSPNPPAGWIARTAGTLASQLAGPNLNYDAVFCDPQTRLVVMVLSLALLSVAICLTNRRSLP